MTTPELQAGINILTILADALRELDEVPNGVFYARISDLMSFNTYQEAIALLKRMNFITESNNVLKWIGPKS